jgi:hypothetical protein
LNLICAAAGISPLPIYLSTNTINAGIIGEFVLPRLCVYSPLFYVPQLLSSSAFFWTYCKTMP